MGWDCYMYETQIAAKSRNYENALIYTVVNADEKG